ncbi:Calcium-dependent protein kinase 2 (PfCDPK2), partial [Durusdinium trenchii]
VRLGNFNFNPADWKNVSDDAKSLIRWMLKMNPRDRYSAAQALNHEWIKNKAPKAQAAPLRSNFVDNLRGFQSQNKLKKAALHIIAGQLNEDEIKKLREAFTSLDKNGDGLLTHSELKDGLGKAGLKEIPPDLAAIMDGVDADGSGVIDYTEFLAATLDRQQYMKEDVCWAAFRVFDRNGDGHISTQELKQVLQSSEVEDALGLKAIADLMVEVDSNGDGMIDFEEFMAMMRGSGEKRGEPTRSATGVQPRLDDRLVLEPLRLVVLEPTDSEDFGHLDVQNAPNSSAPEAVQSVEGWGDRRTGTTDKASLRIDFVHGSLCHPWMALECLGGSVHFGVALEVNWAAASFLLKQREALLSEERMEQKGATQPALQRAIDTLLLKLLLDTDEDDLRLTDVLERGVRCRVDDCEGFLRQRQRLDVLARLWKAHGLYDLALHEWSSMLTRSDARLSTAQIVAEMVEVLRSVHGASGAALLRQFVPQILNVDPAAILPVFTAGRGREGRPLLADEVLQLLEGHPTLSLAFLEHLVARKEAEPRHCAQLGLAYVAKVEEELSLPGANRMTPSRAKLLRFLEEAEGEPTAELLPRLEALELHEELVVLCSREKRHYEALRILALDLNDLGRAEIYCRLLMRREAQESTQGLSVFSAELPPWARPVVFGPKKPGSADRVCSQDPSIVEATVRTRPLMLLLKILLEAHETAAEKPESYKKVSVEYRDAVLALLMGYAGHRDVPPNEVLGLLPSHWTLEGVAEYLSQCARICLHQQRASMLEENLSSMAYLKTFSAWAKERMRKVNITVDRCCPVCNKRFVDKDNVGKAFVAYPNETCVHFTCKEHPSICPKTGKNFSDNLSVYCQALGSLEAPASED